MNVSDDRSRRLPLAIVGNSSDRCGGVRSCNVLSMKVSSLKSIQRRPADTEFLSERRV